MDEETRQQEIKRVKDELDEARDEERHWTETVLDLEDELYDLENPEGNEADGDLD